MDLVKVSSYNSARNLGLESLYGDVIIGNKINFVIVDDSINIIDIFV